MRITVIVHDFEPGGAEKIALRLAREWANSGADVSILSGARDGPHRKLVPANVTVTAPETPIARGKTRRALARFVCAKLASDDQDIIFLPGNYYFGLARAIRKVAPNACVVGKISNAMKRAKEPVWRQSARLWLLRMKSRYLDRIFLAHEAQLPEVWKALGGPQSRFVVAGHPALDTLPPLERREPKAGHVVAAGRLAAQKNFTLAIEAMEHLGDGVTLTIAGEGPLREALLAQVQGANLAERVFLPGFQNDMGQFLADARLFLLSSDYEGFPSVAVEALAHGVPVVATDCTPVIPILLSDAALGRVVPPDDKLKMKKAIVECLNTCNFDRKILQDAVRKYTIANVSQVYMSSLRGAYEDKFSGRCDST